MPPQSKKRRGTIPATIISDTDQPQDYVDPLKKLALNPGQTTAEKVVAAASKRPAVRQRARVSKVARRLGTAPKFDIDESQLTTTEDRELAEARAGFAAANAEDEIKREAARFEELTTVPDITLSATGGLQPGSGAVLSTMLRSGYKGLNSSLGVIGQVMNDIGLISNDAAGEDLRMMGEVLKGISAETAPTLQAYDITTDHGKKLSIPERTAGFITELGIQLPQMALAAELLGPVAGFGVMKVEGLRAVGEQDPGTLAGAFVQGAAEGALLSALGKTKSLLDKTTRTEPVVDLLKKYPVTAQAGAQLIGGAGQTAVDSLLHPDQPTPDWLDYLHGGVANVIMDPVVLGGTGRARKATQAATKLGGQADPSSYNLELPPDNLAKLRQDFWQPQDLPWDNRVTVGLLNRARVQFVDNPADPEGVLYLNPQAAAVIDRASQAVMPGAKILTGVAQGMSLPAKDAQLVAEHLLEKAAQFKETIRQLPDGDPQLHDLATGAVVFESLAEHLQAATAGGSRSAVLRVLNKQKAADPANPVAREFDQAVVGHESTHIQTDKIAKEMGVDPRATISPGWLADHPIGAKVIIGIGDSKSPLQGYEPTEWTNEAIAYAAQPGPDPGLGLTKQERGILVGDYFAAVMDKHGPGVMEQVWVGRMDREVAQVAFKRLYESNRVRYTRDPISGKRLGLEWRGVEVPKFPERLPDNGYGVDRQPHLSKQQDPNYDADILAPTWYSGLERYIKSKVTGPVPAKQLQAQLKNAGLRPGELEWTGVQDWLEEQGSRKVTREEVLAEVARRQVEVREVWKDPADGDAKYATYVQPGESSNYRELLLTLPPRDNVTKVPSEAPMGWGAAGDPTTQGIEVLGDTGADYRSSHFDEPNILAHVRMTDRRGSKGEKVLFIEEVQSDWHQTGAKQGYTPKNLKELQDQADKITAQIRATKLELEAFDRAAVTADQKRWAAELDKIAAIPEDEQMAAYAKFDEREATSLQGRFGALISKLSKLREQENEIRRQIPVGGGVPDGPFKKTWPELAMRRMIRYAAENGYDRVAWVRGEDADKSVGGKSGWFYDRNLINTTNNILKKFGAAVENTPRTPRTKLKPYDFEYVGMGTEGFWFELPDGRQVQSRGAYLDDARFNLAQRWKAGEFGNEPEIARQVWDNSIPITQSMREGVLYQGQPIPLNIQPDPDYDAVHPAGEAADSATAQIDPDVTHLRQSNAPPEISAQVSAQREAERKAYRDVANLRARLRKNNDLAAAATKMQEDSGLFQPELDAEIQQLGAELKQQHVEAVKKFRELRQQGNVLKGQLAGQLGDNTARKRAEAKLAAKGRLANGDQLPPIDTPLDQVRMSNEYGNFLADVAKDMLIASDVPLLSSDEMHTMDQLINALRIGRTTMPQLDEVAKRYGLKDSIELFERFRQFGSAAGRDLNIFARQQREFNKLRGLSPELDEWINSRPPTMQQIDEIANGPSVWRQLVNLNIGATIATLATQTPNVVTGLVNAVGVRGVINLADQVLERAARTSREVTRVGEPSKFEQNAVPPLSSVLAPVFAASTATKDILNNPYWFAHGKLKDGTLNDPAARPAEKSVRIAQELHNFQPELMKKFDSQLSDDVIQIHLLPHAEAVQAERDALTLLKNQVTNMPAGADKFQRLARIKEAEARLAKSDRWLPKVLHEASRGLHKYLTLARMGERFVRTISLVSNLETEASRYGLDLTQLDTTNEIHKLPAAVVERAVNQALQDTYATRPEPGSIAGQAYNWYAKSNNPGAILTSAVFPFVGFMGNYAKMVLDYSPLPIIKAALLGAGETGATVENHQKLIKATLGTAVYVTVAGLIEDKYDEAERTGKPVEPWHSVGGVSVRNVPQLVAPLYIADYVARQKRGLAAPEADTALEFFNILSGLDMRNLTGTFKWLDDLVKIPSDQSGNKQVKTGEALATAFSDWFSRYLTPLNMYNDIGAQYFTSMRDVKDLYGMGAGSLYAPIFNKIPVAREMLSDKIDPYTGMPVHRTDYPAVKAITGFTILPAQSYAAQIFQHAGIKPADWIPFTGVAEVDRDLVATVGKLMKERTANLAVTQQHMDIDQKIVDTYDVARAVAEDAFEEVVSRYPDIERKLEDADEFNRWERRVEDKKRARQGKKSLAEEQQELKSQRKAAGK